MASAHHLPSYSLPPPPPNMHPSSSDFRLPSLKDLNFQYRSPQDGSGPPPAPPGAPSNHAQYDHPPPPVPPASRHDQGSWPRPVSLNQPQPSSNAHEQPPKPVEYPHSKHEGGYLTPGVPLSVQTTPAPGAINSTHAPPREDPAHIPHKRPRSDSAVSSISPGRSPHTPYPPHPPPYAQPVYQSPGPAPHPHEQAHQHPGQYPPPPYAGYPHYMPPRSGVGPPPPVHPSSHTHPGHPPPHGNPYPPPPHTDPHWQHHHPPPQSGPPPPHPQHQPYHQPPPPHQQPHPPQGYGLSRTTPLVPTPLNDQRPPSYGPSDAERVAARQDTLQEIVKHCGVLCSYAERYSKLQQSIPRAEPDANEIAEMANRAAAIMRLLDTLRRITHGMGPASPSVQVPIPHPPTQLNHPPVSERPPKRPWEDIARDENDHGPPPHEANMDSPVHHVPGSSGQTTAEQDMELIRTKRATSSAGSGMPGQGKSKYRKRSRATPPGKCHSCNIRETPEWRRGPDGARTLCNACGLHYAKLMRKRDKALAEGHPSPIVDLETLRNAATQRVATEDDPGEPQTPIVAKGSTMSPPGQLQDPRVYKPEYPSPAPLPSQQPMSHTSMRKMPPVPPPANHHQMPLSGPGQGPPPAPVGSPYQLVPVPSNNLAGPASGHMAPSPIQGSHQQMLPPAPPPHTSHGDAQQSNGVPPPPPWATQNGGRNGYASDHGHAQPHNPQSFARRSHVSTSNARGSPH
ncbi:hypothetical protein NEOLEDRAFT_1238515 [Neolentinus lepideus HHB14362 ss-1]|uniref:GATA-type domain-containing protein n=1 Tax=Neolentinus lepideus HHB14362 ss-1 TaxID=1314782 RepID=A0A165VIZ3_9AGAM|nr:hypothetical protein NEOLEDRAFT_1238515 [Neolentinus lepideus HHB14362 ss-1]